MTEHPLKDVNDAKAFQGFEVEGVVMLGALTVFLRSKVDGKAWEEVQDIQPEQVFLTEQFNDWEWVAETLVPWAAVRDVTVTAGRVAADVESFLAMPVAQNVRVMVRFWNCPWHKKLRPIDEVSIGDVYDMTTFCAGQGQQTKPSDYTDDRSIES